MATENDILFLYCTMRQEKREAWSAAVDADAAVEIGCDCDYIEYMFTRLPTCLLLMPKDDARNANACAPR